MLRPVEVGEGAGHDVAIAKLGVAGQRLEKPSADDLEPLLGAGRAPRRLHAAHYVAQPIEGLAAALPAHLDVGGVGVGRTVRVGRRQTDNEEAVLDQLGTLGHHLGERELGLEAAGRQVAVIVELGA